MENEIYDSVLTTKMLIEKLKELEEDFPEEAIERSDGKKTFKGYNTTGIGYQWCVDRMNKVLGIPHWRTIQEITVEKGTFGSGKDSFHATCQMTIQIINPTSNGVCVLAERFCYGGHISKAEEDAMKGAFTNSFKKTVALFGVGASAYRGTIDDDNVPQSEDVSTPKAKTSPAKPIAPKPPINKFGKIFAIIGSINSSKSTTKIDDNARKFLLNHLFKVDSLHLLKDTKEFPQVQQFENWLGKLIQAIPKDNDIVGNKLAEFGYSPSVEIVEDPHPEINTDNIDVENFDI